MQREAELFEAASRLTDPAARQAFLEQACRHNPAKRQRIEWLLALQPDAEQFFAEAEDARSRLDPSRHRNLSA